MSPSLLKSVTAAAVMRNLQGPILEIAGLRKDYGDIEAVRGLDLTLHFGEIFGLLGPNGAGKTSTINMITGLVKPTSGSISLKGIDCIAHVKRIQGDIGVVPDESNLYDELSGFDNLVFCASLYGMRKAVREQRATELLETFSLSDTGKRPFKAYSKGMKRKLTIAAAIMHQPPVLFLDEPTTGIDVESARQIRLLIKSLNRKGTTIMLTTHYLEEAQRLCGRIAFIARGRIVKTGTVDELLGGLRSDHLLHLTVGGQADQLAAMLHQHHPSLRCTEKGTHVVEISSDSPVELHPITAFLSGHGFPVYEARRVEPTLEDVFIAVTGINAGELESREKGGRKR